MLGATLIAATMLAGTAMAPARGARSGISVKDGVTQPVFSYADAIRETVYVQSSVDGDDDTQLDLIATDIIRPQESDADLKVPVIFEQSPYYQAEGRGNEAEIKQEEDGDYSPAFFPLFYDNYFVPRGYAYIAQDMPGTRNSEGCMVLGGDDEELAAKATIDWLNGRGKAFTADGQEVTADWSTGQVGMIGKSYDASVANGTASTGVDGLETIVPIGGIDRWYDYHLNNGVQYVNAYTTPGLFVFVIDQTPGDDEERGAGWVKATFTENSTCSAKGGEIASSAGDPRGDYNEFWDERDYLKDVEKVKASVFVVHGLNDWNVKPNNYAQWWSALAKRDVPRKIWLSGVGHVDPFDYRREEWVETLHRWFDYWLQDIDNGIMDEPMADIERSSYKWKTYKSWPDAGARKVKLFFGPGKKNGQPGGLKLVEPKPADAPFTDDPEQEESQMVGASKEASANRLLFKTKKLRKSVRVSGRIKVNMRAVVDQVDTNFTALLVDYGKATRIDHEASGEGVQNTDKESCHGESTEEDDACYIIVKEQTHVAPYEIVSRGWLDARHHKSLRESEPLTPGEVYTFKWEIFAEDYVFKKGHRLAIVLAGSDPTWTIPDGSNANITVKLGASKVSLPIVGGRKTLRRAHI
ncbi:MAG: X-Pro dipeptidyl-peptidase [Actinomycetota bacterium]|nr:X-Pro dipeptidyl-peptidase [Actinomycetota bacterium]